MVGIHTQQAVYGPYRTTPPDPYSLGNSAHASGFHAASIKDLNTTSQGENEAKVAQVSVSSRFREAA